jgi:hypothetical protein
VRHLFAAYELGEDKLFGHIKAAQDPGPEHADPENRAGPAQHRTETVMTTVQMRVLSDIWIGEPYGVGSLHLRKGSIVAVDPENAEQIARLGGSGNLGPLRSDETGNDANHAEPGN